MLQTIYVRSEVDGSHRSLSHGTKQKISHAILTGIFQVNRRLETFCLSAPCTSTLIYLLTYLLKSGLASSPLVLSLHWSLSWASSQGRQKLSISTLKLCIALRGNPSQSYGASLAIWDDTVLPATRHKWTLPAITPANQAGTRFTYPGGMEGWVDLGSLIAAGPGIEPTTAWFQVQHPNHYATKTQSHQVFLGRPLSYVPSVSIIYHLTQSVSSLCSTCPNHRSLLLLAGSSPNNSLTSIFFLLSFRLKPHIRAYLFHLCATLLRAPPLLAKFH